MDFAEPNVFLITIALWRKELLVGRILALHPIPVISMLRKRNKDNTVIYEPIHTFGHIKSYD